MGTSVNRAQKKIAAFRMECAIAVNIRATPKTIWTLLTAAADFPRWNSTVTSIEGVIAPGNKLKLRVPLAPGRTFTPTVTEFEAERRMVWTDGFAPMFKGVRTFTLEPKSDGSCDFRMMEVFSGLILPMIKRSLPRLRSGLRAVRRRSQARG
jgi:hypothetical protein